MGGWVGGQARVRHGPLRGLEPAEVPGQGPGDGEDPRPDDAVRHLPDRLPRCCHGRRRVGSTVYIAGAGPVGLAAAASGQLLGAAVVIVGDLNPDRLDQATTASAARRSTSRRATRRTRSSRSSACPRSTAASTLWASRRAATAPTPRRSAGHGPQLDDGCHARRWWDRHPRACTSPVTPARRDEAAQQGSLSIRIGLGWAKSLSFTTGQCPVMKYHRGLMMAILNDTRPDREGGQRDDDPDRRCPAWLRGVRPGRVTQVRARPERLPELAAGYLSKWVPADTYRSKYVSAGLPVVALFSNMPTGVCTLFAGCLVG